MGISGLGASGVGLSTLGASFFSPGEAGGLGEVSSFFASLLSPSALLASFFPASASSFFYSAVSYNLLGSSSLLGLSSSAGLGSSALRFFYRGGGGSCGGSSSSFDKRPRPPQTVSAPGISQLQNLFENIHSALFIPDTIAFIQCPKNSVLAYY